MGRKKLHPTDRLDPLVPGRVYLSRAEGSGVIQLYGIDYIFLVIRTYLVKPEWPMFADILILNGHPTDKTFRTGFQTMTASWWLWRNAEDLV